MSPSTTELEHEVEASRARVERTVDALKDKMTLGQIVDEVASYVGGSGGGQAFANLGSQMRDNPLPGALVGVGLAWLMFGQGRGGERPFNGGTGFADAGARAGFYGDGGAHRDRGQPGMAGRAGSGIAGAAGSVASGIGSAAGSVASGISGGIESGSEALSSAAGGVSSAISSAREGIAAAADSVGSAFSSATGAAGDAAAAVGSGFRHAGEHASGTVQQLGAYGESARRAVADLVHQEPLIIGAIGLAVGAAIGAMLPATEAEDRLFGEQRDALAKEAGKVAAEQIDKVAEVASEAVETVKTAAGEAYEDVRGKVADTFAEVKDTVRESVAAAGETAADERPEPAKASV